MTLEEAKQLQVGDLVEDTIARVVFLVTEKNNGSEWTGLLAGYLLKGVVIANCGGYLELWKEGGNYWLPKDENLIGIMKKLS